MGFLLHFVMYQLGIYAEAMGIGNLLGQCGALCFLGCKHCSCYGAHYVALYTCLVIVICKYIE